MPLIDRIKTGIPEILEQSRIVVRITGMNRFRVIFSEIWCLLMYGARPIDYVRFEFYKKNHHERNRYLTIYRYFRLLKKFGRYNDSTHGKVAEYKTFSDYIRRPWMVLDENTDPMVVKDFIAKNKVVFAKPNLGDQGHGIVKITSNNDFSLSVLLDDCKKGSFVLEKAIENSPEIAAINPSSLNTVRVYSLLKKNRETQILGVMLRVGRKGSYVDNWGSGGIGYNFDLETGICVGYGRDKKNNPYIFHPESNIQMVGFKLPSFDRLKQLVVEMSQMVPEARFVGWDIAITPNGYELVEMNCPGGHDFLQAFGCPYGDIIFKELK